MGQSQKIALMVGVALLISVGSVSYLWAQAPNFVPLYTGLSSHSGGEVVAALQKMGVKYKVEAGGAVIAVPSSKASLLRLKLAAQDLPGNGQVSFQSLSDQPLGTSQFIERVQYQRALSNALARTIDSISAVQSTRVNLAIPPPPVFMDSNRKPTASVLVNLKPGAQLSPTQVIGIQHLVASSVVGLADKSVSVVDQNGTLLSGAGLHQGSLGPGKLDYQTKIEQRLEAQIVSLLDPIVGNGHVRVSVAADINFSKVKTASVTYHKGAILSEQSQTEVGGMGAAPAGIPGALSNTPPGAASAPIKVNKKVITKRPKKSAPAKQVVPRSSTSTINYNNDKIVQELATPPGAITRLSIAVLLDEPAEKNAKGKVKAKRFSASEITRITALVKSAVGFDAKRGDSVSVVSMPFSRRAVSASQGAPWWKSPYVFRAGKYLLAAIGFLALWFMLIRPILRAALKRVDPERHSSSPQASLDSGKDDADGAVERIIASEATLADRLRDAHASVDEDPAGAARVIREWLSDGR